MALTKIEVSSISDDAISTAKIANSAISTAKIADDAVSLAKLAAGTDGELITWDAAGNPAAVAVGTATHVLTSNGTGAAPTFQAAAGGIGEVVIGATTFTGVRNINIGASSPVFEAGYNYQVYIYNGNHTDSGTAEGDSKIWGLQLLTNGSYQTSNYGYRMLKWSGGTDTSLSGQASIRMSPNALLAGNNKPRTTIMIEFLNPAASSGEGHNVQFRTAVYPYASSIGIDGSIGAGFHPATYNAPITGCSIVLLAPNTLLETSATFSGTYVVTRTAITA